ncbi:PR-1-like protein [Microthyrium microscopicum]|uniref:PR-1-like protein n=1 Tax=Microthyrium microscopicum TaxID=703497 RepID=A0A6A6U828_9PEZI|nr:PR-1-like protein [Microthyrium microscopicum]
MRFSIATILALATSFVAETAAFSIYDPKFQASCVQAHNDCRSKHCSPNVNWNNDLAVAAQSSANQCVFKHIGSGYGQNLLGVTTTTGYADFDFNQYDGIAKAWYGEGAKYNYSRPGWLGDASTGELGHFTQVVWKASVNIGCAWNSKPCPAGDGKWSYYFYCNYTPQGNVYTNGPDPNILFEQNVLPEGCGGHKY